MQTSLQAHSSSPTSPHLPSSNTTEASIQQSTHPQVLKTSSSLKSKLNSLHLDLSTKYKPELDQEHQRTPTTIIKDIANSYTFITNSNGKRDTFAEEDDLSCSLISDSSEIKQSGLFSTMDPKSFYQKPPKPGECYSNIFTVSSSSCEERFSAISENLEKKEELLTQHSLLSPVVAFCNKCQDNVSTEVIENLYPGNFWERLFCSFCVGSAKLREFSHICAVCEEVLFNIKIKVD